MLLIILATLNSLLGGGAWGATETGQRQEDFVVPRDFAGSGVQVRGNGGETREIGF